jgi:hypothetical protein
MPKHAMPVEQSKRATLDELWQLILILEQQHNARSITRKVGKYLQPLISFIERFSPAVDVAVQGTINPAALAWGAIRVLLVVSYENYGMVVESVRLNIPLSQVCGAFARYFDSLLVALENIGLAVSIFQRYESLLGGDPGFRSALSVVT